MKLKLRSNNYPDQIINNNLKNFIFKKNMNISENEINYKYILFCLFFWLFGPSSHQPIYDTLIKLCHLTVGIRSFAGCPESDSNPGPLGQQAGMLTARLTHPHILCCCFLFCFLAFFGFSALLAISQFAILLLLLNSYSMQGPDFQTYYVKLPYLKCINCCFKRMWMITKTIKICNTSQ